MVDKNITNWKSYTNEQRFLLYQVQSLKIGGIGACIIPRSNFNNTIKKTTEFKAELMKNIRIIKIINCNSKVFAPIASVECAIIIYQKLEYSNIPYYSENVEIIDYSNDGYIIKDKTRIKQKEPEIKSQIKTLKYIDDWNFQKEITEITPDIKQLILLERINNKYYETLDKIKQIKDIEGLENNIIKLKLSDIFEPIKLKTYKNEDNGIYPLYGSTKLNKISGYSNNYSIDTNSSDDLLIKLYGICCIGKTGSAGYLNVHKGKFAINSTVLPCKIKIKLSDLNLSYISIQLSRRFNYSNTFTVDKINIEVNIINNETLFKEFDLRIKTKDIDDIKIKEWKKIKISDYFIIPKLKQVASKSTYSDGDYPLISSSSNNNGIIKYINHFDYDGDYITVARSGSVGSSFYQNSKFSIDTSVKILQPKENNSIDLYILAVLLNWYLPQKYSYINKITNQKLLNEEVNIPIFE